MHDLDDEREEDGIVSGDSSLLDDEDPELVGLDDDEEDEDPLKNGFSAMEEEEPDF